MGIRVSHFNNHPISSSCYLVTNEDTNKYLLVDPGTLDMSYVYKEINPKNIDYIILTHEHFDHILGCNDLWSKFKIKVICSQVCAIAIKDAKKNMSLFNHPPGFVVNNDVDTIDDFYNNFLWDSQNIKFYEAKGHSSSGIMFCVDSFLFTGDTLLENIPTVTKLYTGSKDELKKNIKIIENYKGRDVSICPGHGEIFKLDQYDLSKAFKK